MISGITGAHWILHTTDAEADRAFFRDVLGWRSVDAGHGWLIFATPDSELACHPRDAQPGQQQSDDTTAHCELFLMCGDIEATVKSLAEHKVTCGAIEEAPWGRYAIVPLPSGASIGLYQPSHPTAV